MAKDFATIRAKGTWTLQKRSDFRKEVQAGKRSVSLMLENKELPDWLQNAQIGRTLRYVPGIGEKTARVILGVVVGPDFTLSPIHPATRLKAISHSRRVELAEALRERE